MKAKIAHCNLNQGATDYNGNKRRIIESIRRAREMQCTYRACQEMEITGYGCMDHFTELDTFRHAWNIVGDLLEEPGLCAGDMIIETSIPIIHRGASFNCKVIIFNYKIILIRPKLFLYDGGAGNESRWFVPYTPVKDNRLEEYLLPRRISEITKQERCPFGVATIKTKDADISLEICEEVWRLNSPSRCQILNSDILFCCNASYFSLDKLQKRIAVVNSGVQNFSGGYVYVNAIGCEGDRTYYDGHNIVIQNGEIIQIGPGCSLEEVLVTPVVFDLTQIRQSKLSDICNMREAGDFKEYNSINVNFSISSTDPNVITNKAITPVFEDLPTQILQATSAFLWDYIRKSGARGLFLPLSGGADSGVTSLLVYNLAERIFDEFNKGSEFVKKTLREIVQNPDFIPKNPKEIMSHILYTAYLPTEYSSKESRDQAQGIANFVGCSHFEMDITPLVKQFRHIAQIFLGKDPKFASEGGTLAEDLSLQNVQARTRMVVTYLLAQLAPSKFNRKGFLLTLGTGNVNETILGYFTKYDCSSGDINLIGSLSKKNIYKVYDHFYKKTKNEWIKKIWDATPSAELRPQDKDGVAQTDETEIGLTYNDIFTFTQLRNVSEYGIVSTYEYLRQAFPDMDHDLLFNKVKTFYEKYRKNRHKTVVLTPSVHISSNSCDDSRYDFRPFMYGGDNSYEFRAIEKLIEEQKELEEQGRMDKVEIEGRDRVLIIDEKYVNKFTATK